jgi:hypothetical protein
MIANMLRLFVSAIARITKSALVFAYKFVALLGSEFIRGVITYALIMKLLQNYPPTMNGTT